MSEYFCKCGQMDNFKIDFEICKLIYYCNKCDFRFSENSSQSKVILINFMWGKKYLLEKRRMGYIPPIMIEKDENEMLTWNNMICDKIYKRIRSSLIDTRMKLETGRLKRSTAEMFSLGIDVDPFCLHHIITDEKYDCSKANCSYGKNHGGRCALDKDTDIQKIIDIFKKDIYKIISIDNLYKILRNCEKGINYKEKLAELNSKKIIYHISGGI